MWLRSILGRRRSSASWVRQSAPPSPPSTVLMVFAPIFEDTVAAFEGDTARDPTSSQKRASASSATSSSPASASSRRSSAEDSGIRIDNGVVVDEYCETNVSGVYAAGDVANHYQPLFGRHIRIEHWQNAIKQGAAAARNMLGKHVPYDEVPWFWSDQYDANLQYAGFHTKWDQIVLRGRVDSASFLACYINDGRIDAVVGFNRGKDVRRVMPLIKSRRAVDVEQLRDEGVDLRSLNASS